ncbi:MAG TPA: hypothetical protein VFP21_09005 [Solirubrobacterales bacterium]|nr:hypothetical protein [Solirubrobacterales bacterium]
MSSAFEAEENLLWQGGIEIIWNFERPLAQAEGPWGTLSSLAPVQRDVWIAVLVLEAFRAHKRILAE